MRALLLIVLCTLYAWSSLLCESCLATTVTYDMSEKNYKEQAKITALKNLSYQLYSMVGGRSALTKSLLLDENNDKFRTEYFEEINIKYNTPIIGADEIVKYENNQYILMMILDYKKSSNSYKNIAINLAKQINSEYGQIQKIDNQFEQKRQLLNLRKKYFQYEIYRDIALIMGEHIGNRIVSLYKINMDIKKLSQDIFLDNPIEYKGYQVNTKDER
jgi:hypothetical protein